MKTFLLSIFLLPFRFHWFARLYPHLCNPSRMKSSKYYITLFSCVPFVLSSVVKSFSWQKKEKNLCFITQSARPCFDIFWFVEICGVCVRFQSLRFLKMYIQFHLRAFFSQPSWSHDCKLSYQYLPTLTHVSSVWVVVCVRTEKKNLA